MLPPLSPGRRPDAATLLAKNPMSQPVDIRAITEQDIDGFRAAVDAVARERIYLSRREGPDQEGAAHFVRNTIAQGHPQYVAISGNRLVGWCDIVRSTGDYESHVGTMGMGLLPEWREQGLGRRLLLATLERADSVGITRVELSVHASNLRAIALYRRLGFLEEGRLHKARIIDGRAEDIILMAKLHPSLGESGG